MRPPVRRVGDDTPWPNSPMLSLRQVCALLDCSPYKVRIRVETRALRAIKVGQVWRVPRSEIAERLTAPPA